MATHRIPIVDWSARPDASGNCYPAPWALHATNDTWKQTVFVFKNAGAVRINLYGSFQVPKDYVGSGAFAIKWTSQTTSGDVVWDIDYRSIGAGESLDQAAAQESLSVTDAAPGTTDLMQEASVAATAGNFAADDLVEFLLARDISDANDDLGDNVQLFSLEFQYADA